MSTKDEARIIKQYFETVQKTSEDLSQVSKFDKELSTKIKQVVKSSEDIVKHIEKRSG